MLVVCCAVPPSASHLRPTIDLRTMSTSLAVSEPEGRQYSIYSTARYSTVDLDEQRIFSTDHSHRVVLAICCSACEPSGALTDDLVTGW